MRSFESQGFVKCSGKLTKIESTTKKEGDNFDVGWILNIRNPIVFTTSSDTCRVGYNILLPNGKIGFAYSTDVVVDCNFETATKVVE